MTSFVRSRATAPALVLWSVYVATWGATTASSPATVGAWWLAGVGLVQLLAHPLYHRPGRSDANAGTARVPVEEQAFRDAVGHPKHAVEDWESEGGAVATS